MILTLTLNPALDKSTEIDRLIPEKKMRCTDIRTDAGGGGINVSKAILELGGDSLAIYPSGGDNGRLMEKVLSNAGVRSFVVPMANETRENFVATETSTNKQFRFTMPGPSLTVEELRRCIDAVEKHLPSASFLVCSGSLPDGVPDDFLATLAAKAAAAGVKFIADTSGIPLRKAVEAGVYLVKPNLSELGSLVGKDYLELSEIDDAAREVIASGGSEIVVASMGPGGAMVVTRDKCKRILAPDVRKQSTVGAGDSMVGGTVWMLQQGADIEAAVRFGIACGTAATMNKGTQLFKKGDVERLHQWMLQQS